LREISVLIVYLLVFLGMKNQIRVLMLSRHAVVHADVRVSVEIVIGNLQAIEPVRYFLQVIPMKFVLPGKALPAVDLKDFNIRSRKSLGLVIFGIEGDFKTEFTGAFAEKLVLGIYWPYANEGR